MNKKQGSLLVSLAVSAVLASTVRANPNGPSVVNGQVTFDASQAGVLNIANSPNAIIEWQGFSIPAGEITRFIQENAGSAVLNRVVGQDPSTILGQLLSNGQVFLINPNGVIFGQGSMVDTAGLLASTLNISNDDFRRGNYLFANPGPGKIENFGVIHVGNGGSVVLISPNITNNGLIQSDGGHVVLAAGERLTLTSMENPQIRFEIQAPADKVLNIGQLMANGGGSIDIFAGTIQSSGVISADSVQVDKNGQIHLVAQGDITLDAQSQTHANGPNGGTVLAQSQNGTTSVFGTVEAKGSSGVGGTVELLAERVGLFDNAKVDVSGKTGGGTARLGGDRQGLGTTQRAKFTYIGENAQVHADAVDTGNGGTVIAYADDTTRIYGHLSARGGSLSGNGGFVETSGKKGFEILAIPDTRAPNGLGGEWLIDPDNISIVSTGTPTYMGAGSGTFTSTNSPASIDVSTITSYLNQYGGTISFVTGTNTGDAGNIDWNATLDMSTVTGTGRTLSLRAANNINFNSGGITNGGSNALNLELWANNDGVGGGQANFYAGNLDLGTSGWLKVVSGTNATSGLLNFANTAPVTIRAGGGIYADTLNITGGMLSSTSSTSNPQQFSNAVTLDGQVSVNRLNLNGQLNSNNNIEVRSALNWTQGVIGGIGSNLRTLGTTTINQRLAEVTGNRTWTNTGTINWSGSSLSGLNLWGSALLKNQGTMNVSSSVRLGGNSTQGLVNDTAGTVNVSGGWLSVPGAFSNAGNVNVNGGGMWVGSSGTDSGSYNLSNSAWLNFYNSAGSITRTFNGAISNVDKTAGVYFSNGVFNLNRGLDVGTVDVGGSAAVNVAGDYNSNRETYIGGALNVTGSYTQLAGGGTILDYGTLTATSVNVSAGSSPTRFSSTYGSSAGSFEGSGTVNLNGGTFTNSGGVYVWGGPLTINGNYVQTFTGELGIAFVSPAAYGFLDSEDYNSALYSSTVPGSLSVNGTATMAGALFILWDGLGASSYRAIETTGGLYGSFSNVSHYPTAQALGYEYDGKGLTVGLASVSGTKDGLVKSNTTLIDDVFDKSTDNILAMMGSTSFTNSNNGAGLNSDDGVGKPKSCKK